MPQCTISPKKRLALHNPKSISFHLFVTTAWRLRTNSVNWLN